MFFHWSVFLYSLVFWGVVELISAEDMAGFLSVFFNTHIWLFALVVVMFLGYVYKVAHKISRRGEMTIISVLFAFSVLLLSYFVDSPSQRHLFSFLTGTAYYFLHLGLHRLKLYEKDKTAYAIIAAAASATVFLFYAGAYGFYLNFNLPLWILMLSFFLVTALVSYQYFFLIIKEHKEVLKYALLLGFVMMEIAWAINFWPFGYLTTSVITLIFYYVFWDTVQAFALKLLTKKRILNNVLLCGLLIAFVLLTSRWVAVV